MTEYDEGRSLDLSEARKLIRGRGGDASLEVLRRYASPKRGCRPRGDAGPVIVLRTVKVGGRLRTMPEWVEEFVRARAAAGERLSAPQGRPARSRLASMRRAAEVLDRAGIG